ncbi:MAG: hypothetical protein HY390_03035 [Deltaproteobacteria bacterium]|nr:hypothetical protein [Deltaproteobacteria bacterium]
MIGVILVLWANGRFTPLVSSIVSHASQKTLFEENIDLNFDGQLEKVSKIQTEHGIMVQVQSGLFLSSKVSFAFLNMDDGFLYDHKSITPVAFVDINQDHQLDLLVSFFHPVERETKVYPLVWDKSQNTLTLFKKED